MTVHPMPDGVWHKCWKCKSDLWLPQSLNEAANHARGRISFWCPYGHEAVKADGETEENKLRRERDRLAQQIAQRDDEIRHQKELLNEAEKKRVALSGQINKLNKRVSAGVCPCCTRSFQNLRRHISMKHPDYGGNGASAPTG